MFDEGFYLPEGGMGTIPRVLCSAFLKHGGEIFVDAKVEKIRVSNSRSLV